MSTPRPSCIAKGTGLYFTEADALRPCRGRVHIMAGFWAWHKSGNLDAAICDHHATIAIHAHTSKSYIVEQIRKVRKDIPNVWATDRLEECWP